MKTYYCAGLSGALLTSEDWTEGQYMYPPGNVTT